MAIVNEVERVLALRSDVVYELSLLIRANDTIVTLWWNRFACRRQTLDAS